LQLEPGSPVRSESGEIGRKATSLLWEITPPAGTQAKGRKEGRHLKKKNGGGEDREQAEGDFHHGRVSSSRI